MGATLPSPPVPVWMRKASLHEGRGTFLAFKAYSEREGHRLEYAALV